MMFYSIGTLLYIDDPLKLVLRVDDTISDYYRSLIPKHIKINKQKFGAHITVVRNEDPGDLSYWGMYANAGAKSDIAFSYNNVIHNDDTYWWLEICCPELIRIRNELDLPDTSEFTRSPDGIHSFHMTIGNTKK